MAGGKETPRQRMIGMMYLVLTALLALQVSNQILQKFILLNDGMERTSKNYIEKNTSLLENIESKIEEPGTDPKDLPLSPAAKKIRANTKEIFDHLEALKLELIELSNAKNDQGNFVTSSLKNTEAAGNIFGVNGKGEVLKQKLNDYPKSVESILKEAGLDKETILQLQLKPIARDASEITLFANDSEAKYKNFVTLNFVKSPVGAVLAILSQFQSDVLNIESDALSAISRKIGSTTLVADKTKAIITSNSKFVVAGTKFQGEMFIAAYSSSVSPTMSYNNGPISVGEEGVGKIEFQVPDAKDYDDKLQAKRTLNGKITYNVGGEDKTLETTFEYFIVKPVIKVSAAVVQQLYAECANELTISVPSLGNEYSPQFTVLNGTAAPGSNGKVTIYPNSSGKVSVGVKSQGIDIGTETFDIKQAPLPSINILKPDGTELDMALSHSAQSLASINIVAKADPDFQRTMAKDSKYEVNDIEYSLVRNEVPRGAPVGKSGLRGLLGGAVAGDILVVRIKQVNRINYKNQPIKTPVKGSFALRVK